MNYLILAARLVFGAWMVVNGLNFFFLDLYAQPTGTEPLAVQLITALVNSRLLDVVMAMQLVGGALILAGVFVPAALYVLIPLNACALFWAVILEHDLTGSLLGLAAFALNGLLMLAYVDYYLGVLQRRARSYGDA